MDSNNSPSASLLTGTGAAISMQREREQRAFLNRPTVPSNNLRMFRSNSHFEMFSTITMSSKPSSHFESGAIRIPPPQYRPMAARTTNTSAVEVSPLLKMLITGGKYDVNPAGIAARQVKAPDRLPCTSDTTCASKPAPAPAFRSTITPWNTRIEDGYTCASFATS